MVKVDPAVLQLVGAVVAVYVFYLLLKRFVFGGRKEVQRTASASTAKLHDGNDKRPRITILYGSQTGTAEVFSNALSKEGERWGFRCVVHDLFQYDRDALPSESMVVLCVASYGEGEPTDNAQAFYEWIMSSEAARLDGVRFTVFGLGNRQYKHYQKIGRDFDQRLSELGAIRAFERGEGNADINIEEDFEDWKARLFPALSAVFSTKAPDAGSDALEPTFMLKEYPSSENIELRSPFQEPGWNNPCDRNFPYKSKVLANRELLLNPGMRSTRHVEFDIAGGDVAYEAGDHLGVYPKNDSKHIDALCYRLNIAASSLDTQISVVLIDSPNDARAFFPCRRTTLRRVFEWYVDILAPPKKNVLRVLARYCSSAEERARLEFMADASAEENKLAYKQFITDSYRSLLDVLNAFPSCAPSIAHLLEVLPRLQPRYYSISSSKSKHPNSIHACVAVLRYETPLNRIKEGCCSSFLSTLEPGDFAMIFVRRSAFHLPSDPTRPVVMIGPGTGLAPFVGFVQQRSALVERGVRAGPCALFFGCRRQREDFIYEEELQTAHASGAISDLIVAFSRDAANKVYVQDKMQEHSSLIWDCVSNNGVIFVCGDAKYMAKDVDKTLAIIIAKHRGCSVEEAHEQILKLEASSRYLRDVWSP
eukprot:ANDGO_02444.mRNA.1 NADPH--cytochrome P450 reductase